MSSQPKDDLYKGHPDQVAGMAAWRAYWASMPPKPDYAGACCLCGNPLPKGRKYVCEGCS